MRNSPAQWGAVTRPRLWVAVAAVVLLQVVLILYLSDWEHPVPPAPAATTWLQLVGGPAVGSAEEEISCLGDPTLFALPTTSGFAGAAWQVSAEPVYESADWAEPIRWLGRKPPEVGLSLLELVRPRTRTGPWATEKGQPDPTVVQGPPVPVPADSALRAEGGLVDRGLLSAPRVPTLTHSNVLAETVIEAWVHPAGFVLSATVLRSSGWKSADRIALDLARQVQFRESDTGWAARGAETPERGRLVFQWRTLAPEAKAEEGG